MAASGDPSWVTDSVVAAYTAGAAADLDGTLKAFLRMAEAREPERLAPHLGEIQCPVRLLIGTAPHDGGIPAGDVEKLRATLSSLSIESVPGSGLYIYEEQPQAVVDAVKRVAYTSSFENLQAPATTNTRPTPNNTPTSSGTPK